MTALLASVIGLEEARIVLAAGADIIDLKDPSTGALGALPLATIDKTVSEIAGTRLCSATVGDLPPDPNLLPQAIHRTAATGVDFVKIGFFEAARGVAYIRAARITIERGVKVIAVLFADLKPDFRILRKLAAAGFTGVMLDTANKSRGGLREHASHHQLSHFIQSAKQLGLLTGLAGSLTPNDIPALVRLDPHYLGFRTALCHHLKRTDRIDYEAVNAVRSRITASISGTPSISC